MFTLINKRIAAAREGRDSGIAMILVIGVGTVLSILVVAAVALSIGGAKNSRESADWNSSLAAAYAGVEEYQSRLADDPTYHQYGNPASDFSTPALVRLPTGTQVNPAFGVGPTGTWASVPGSNGTAKYRYEVDNANYGIDGTIRVRATGLVGDETRSIVADLKQKGFIDFLYFTDYEIQDPELSDDPSSCVKYAWAGRSSSCSNIAFGANDVIDGPMHSNDTVRACYSVFKGAFTTAYNPTSGLLYSSKDSNGNGCAAPTFELSGYPKYSPVVGMPSTNSQLKKETRSDLPVEVPRPGCLYTGPTTIEFKDNGTVKIRSPWTRATRTAGDPATSGTTPAPCGVPGTGSGQLGSSGGATITVPENNVIYVQNVPSVDTNPNYRSSSSRPTGLTCTNAEGEGNGNGVGFPLDKERVPSGTPYGCRNGDIFVKGTLSGNATIAAENYVYVTGDLKYKDSQEDMLGIVGQNAVFVYNPVKNNDGNPSLLNGSNRRIDAAILSVAHTFQVQNYDRGGNRGNLEINGAIAQKFRGIVRNGTNGYAKDYDYDPRLKYTAPPKFLSPVTTSYGVNVWVEVSPIYDSAGNYR